MRAARSFTQSKRSQPATRRGRLLAFTTNPFAGTCHAGIESAGTKPAHSWRPSEGSGPYWNGNGRIGIRPEVW